eukprot:1196411-Prorocentrum_minimum.AAC.3
MEVFTSAWVGVGRRRRGRRLAQNSGGGGVTEVSATTTQETAPPAPGALLTETSATPDSQNVNEGSSSEGSLATVGRNAFFQPFPLQDSLTVFGAAFIDRRGERKDPWRVPIAEGESERRASGEPNNSRRESNSPVVEWLNKGLMAAWSPTERRASGERAEREYIRSGYQSQKGRENIPAAGTDRRRGERIYP